MRSLLLLVAAAVLGHFVYKYSGSDEWHALPEKDGVKVFWQKMPGTTIVKYKGVTRFRSSLTSITRFMQDPTTCDDVGCSDYVVLDNVSPQVQYMSFVYNYKPFSKRQFVVKVEVLQDPNSKEVTVHYASDPNRIPANDCCVRVPHMNNTWTFKPAGNGELDVEYIVDMYEGGMIPYFVYSAIHEKTEYIALRNISNFVVSDKYKEKYGDASFRLPYITEADAH
ncbi:MAG: hypothetical protein ABIW82_00260 [Dokdonella sp.]